MNHGNPDSLARRTFLKAAGFGLVIPTLASGPVPSSSEVERGAASPVSAPDEFRRRLAGPIQSQPTPFNEKREVDHLAVSRMVQRALRYQAPIFALTAGNSQYHSR